MKNSIIISSKEKNRLVNELPSLLKPFPVASLKGKASSNNGMSFPCNWSEIDNLFTSYDHIILWQPVFSNDHLHQGKRKHMAELISILFWTGAIKYKKKLSVFSKGELTPIVAAGFSRVEASDKITANLTRIGNEVIESASFKSRNTVTSIQKIPVQTLSGTEWATFYFRWLQRFTQGLISIKKEGESYPFQIRGLKRPLIILERNEDWQIDEPVGEFIIKGGFLNNESSEKQPLGRFWFVVSPDKKYLYTALIHFKPSLPWWFYRLTQGAIHAVVMKQFSSFVKREK